MTLQLARRVVAFQAGAEPWTASFKIAMQTRSSLLLFERDRANCGLMRSPIGSDGDARGGDRADGYEPRVKK